MAATEHRFRAMASAGQIVVVDAPLGLAIEAVGEVARLEDLWSRFLDHSDISRLNRAGGSPVQVAPDTLVLIATLVEAWRRTGGRCDASTLPATLANGYRSSIDDDTRTTAIPESSIWGADLNRIIIDADIGDVTLPARCTLDPGAIGKGLAADRVADWLLDRGAAGALVSLGGDLAAVGTPPEPDGWFVTVADPWLCDDDLCTVRIQAGGVATSSTRTRRWRHDGVDRHHLIDPGTGRQSATDLVAVTVMAATAWEAEAIATGAILGGSDDVLAYFAAHDVDGIATDRAGRHRSSFVDLPPRRVPGACA